MLFYHADLENSREQERWVKPLWWWIWRFEKSYDLIPKAKTTHRKVYHAEIKLHAGILNQNRALFEEGLRDWQTHKIHNGVLW